AVDPGPGVALQRGALLGVETVDATDERLEAAGDEVVDLAAGRDLAGLAVDDVLDHGGEGEHQAITDARVPGALVLRPQLHGLLSGATLGFRSGCHVRDLWN